MVRRTSCAVEVGIDLVAERIEPRPAFIGERLGDARRLGDALHAHLEVEVDVGACRRAPLIGAAER